MIWTASPAAVAGGPSATGGAAAAPPPRRPSPARPKQAARIGSTLTATHYGQSCGGKTSRKRLFRAELLAGELAEAVAGGLVRPEPLLALVARIGRDLLGDRSDLGTDAGA